MNKQREKQRTIDDPISIEEIESVFYKIKLNNARENINFAHS